MDYNPKVIIQLRTNDLPFYVRFFLKNDKNHNKIFKNVMIQINNIIYNSYYVRLNYRFVNIVSSYYNYK